MSSSFNGVIDTTLRDALRTLNLSGMLATLDARLAQACAGELGHLDSPPGAVPRRDRPP